MIAFARDRAAAALRFLSTEVRGLHAAFYVLAISALLSSLLALLRDRLLAHTFGAGTALDLYYAAFRIPDLIFVATAALVSVYILIPELARRSQGEQRSYIDTIVVVFALFAMAVSGVAALLAPTILPLLYPSFVAAGQMPALVELSRIMLLQPILLGLSNILAAVTQSRSRYWLYSISPLLYNAGIILGAIVLYREMGIAGLAWGVVLGAALHFGIQLPSVMTDGFLRSLPTARELGAILQTVAVSVPRALALSMNQLVFLGLTALAATLSTGSIAVFMFAFNLQAVPLGIIGASYSVAAFPTLAEALARGDRNAFIKHIATAARYVFFWSLPATALVIVLRAYIVRAVLGSGQFDWTDTRLTAAALAILALALAAQSMTLLLVRGYYAAGRTFTPFIVSLGSAVATITLAAGLLGVFTNVRLLEIIEDILRISDVPGANMVALAFAYSAVAILSTLVLTVHFERKFRGFVALTGRGFIESCIAGLAAGIGAYVVLVLLGPITLASTTLSVLLHGIAGGIIGLMCAAATYYALGNQEYAETIEAAHQRVFVRPRREPTTVVSAEEGAPVNPQ